ncbi:MAG: 50S ribosomal protein L24 [Candidatus Aenigmarchaeota archaeon]|nr:50S ribosomal protein L24 [Candidatus Aenigmarchaeota archaeon]
MNKEYSRSWAGSSQPRKQRKYRSSAPLHLRHAMLAAHLDKALRKETGRRSMSLRKGDEVVVMRGEFKKTSGKISRIDRKALKVYVEGVKRKKMSGKDVDAPVDPSNLSITKLYRDDKKRKVTK